MAINIASSSEFQTIVLSTLMKDDYLYTKTSRYISEVMFDKYQYKVIYKSLKFFYEKYNKLPSLNELLVIISDFLNPEIMSLEDIRLECTTLYNSPSYDENFVTDKILTFIRRSAVEDTLKEYLPKVSSGDSIAIDQLGEELSSKLDVSLTRSSAFKLSDINKLAQARIESVGTETNPRIIKSFSDSINNALLFKGYKSGDLIMICAGPGTGKSMYMVNEGAAASMQGFKVLHLFIGDMKEYDGLIRYLSLYTQIPQRDIINMPITQQAKLIKDNNMLGFFDNLVVSSYGAGEITIDEMIQEVNRLQTDNRMHFDMILVDYADNLIPTSDIMYESGGMLYNKLALLGYKNKSVIIVGSQPKQSFWDEEIIPKNAAAESSKKQHVIDVMITMGRSYKGSKIGSMFLAKVRRGEEGRIIRYRTHYEIAKIEPISETDYLQSKANQE